MLKYTSMDIVEQTKQTGGIADYDRLAVLRNPNSTNAADWENYTKDLEENGGLKVAEMITSHKNPSETAEELSAKMRGGDLLYILGGDGLANDAAQYLGDKDSPEIAALFSPLGNACNSYNATIDSDKFDGQPSKILENAVLKDIFPLRGHIRSENGFQGYDQLALSILSVGALATGAAVLDQPKFRNNVLRRNPHTRLPYELYISLVRTPPKLKTLEIADPDGGNPRLALDILAANVPEMAKLAHFDTEITEHDFLVGTLKNKLPWNFALSMVRLMRGTMPVERITDSQRDISFQLTNSKRNRNAMIEFDGEAKPLTAGSHVTIDQVGHGDASHKPIPVITVR